MPEEQKYIFTPESGGGLFSFFGNKPTSYQALEMRRRIAEKLASQKKGFPKNVGEGLTYLGESIGEAGMMARLEAADRAYQQQFAGDQQRELTPPSTMPTPASNVTAPSGRTSEADTGLPPIITAGTERPVSTETSPALSYADPNPPTPPPTVTAPPIDVSTSAPRPSTLPPATPRMQQTASAPPTQGVTPPPMNTNPAAEKMRLQYLTSRGLSPTDTDVSMPPPVQTAAIEPPMNADPAAEQFRKQFLASPRFNPFADPGAIQGGEGTTAPILPPTFERTASGPERLPSPVETPLPQDVPLPPPRPVYNRNAQIAELEANPALVARIQAIVKGEVDPRASLDEKRAAVEEIFNRAAARNHSIDRVTQMYTGRGSIGYYPPETFKRGNVVRPGETEAFQRDVLLPVLRGSDVGGRVLGFSPTGNASGGVAARGVASGRYNVAGRFPGSAETYVQQERPDQLAQLSGTRLSANPDYEPPVARDQIAATLATRQMQPTRGVGNLAGSQQFGTGESGAVREGDLPGGYGPGIKTAAFAPPPDTGGPDSSDVAQEARVRDVIGLSRAGPRNPATASLGGRAGSISDAPLPGLAPLPSATDAGIAKTIELRNKITDDLLNQQKAPTAPVVPPPDPTQPGTELSPTEAPSSSPTTSPALPNARYAQASFADRFAQAPQALAAPTAPAPVAPPPAPAAPERMAPRVMDVPVAPQAIPGPFDKPTAQPAAPAVPLGADKSKPLPPDPVLNSPEEARARDILRQHPGDPNYAALAAEIAKPGVERRAAINKANHDAYLKELDVWTKDTEEKNKARLPEAVLKQREAEQTAAQAERDRIRFGSLGKDFYKEQLKDSYTKVSNLPGSVLATNNARQALTSDPKMFTGMGADLKVSIAKLAAAMGREADPRLPPTEMFRSFMAPLLAQMRSSVVGPGAQSEKELATLQQAVGSDFKLERKSIEGILNAVERLNFANAMAHQKKLEAFVANDENDRRMLFPTISVPNETLAQMVPAGAVNELLANANDPKALKEFDEAAHTPGLAQHILRTRSRR